MKRRVLKTGHTSTYPWAAEMPTSIARLHFAHLSLDTPGMIAHTARPLSTVYAGIVKRAMSASQGTMQEFLRGHVYA